MSTFVRDNVELIWIQLICSGKPILFGVFYRPPNSPDSYLLELQYSLSLLPSKCPIFICGDFNLPNIDWESPSVIKSDKQSSLLLTMMDDFSLEQCVSSPTRGSSLLDLVFTNSRDLISSVEVVDNLPNTDHDCIEFVLDVLPPKQVTLHRTLYNYKKTDFDLYRRALDSVPWDLAEDEDIDLWWTQWKDLFFATVHDTVCTVQWRRRRMKNWLSSATIQLIRLKRLCYKKLKKMLTPSLQAKYKLLRNKVRSATRLDFQTYADSITNNLHRGQKAFWNWINKFRSCRTPIPSIHHHDGVVSDDCTKADLFNKYFVSVFTKENLSNLPDTPPFSPNVNLDSMQVSPSEVFSELSTLDTNKACGPDGICPRLLREGAEQLAKPLASLFNKSLADGLLPFDWVSANITPVFKKGNKHRVGNYRPISLTCILVKVLERIIFNKLYSLLESHKVLNNAQFGFRRKRSTTTLLLSAVNDWAFALNNRLSTHCVFLDFAKAFDSVPHQRLLLKLKAYGINGSMLRWFSSFLTTRRQRVVINGCASDWSPVSSGVPQGSILGPLLFILYINDLPSVVGSTMKIFADDVALYCSVASQSEINAFQQDLDHITDWCNKWQMRLNPAKCELLCLSNKHAPAKPLYYINNHLLNWATSVRYLGVIVDPKLSWNQNISYVSEKATKVLNLLRRHMYTCRAASKQKAFRALVIPVLDYASPVWNPHTNKNCITLERIQSRGARWICGSRFCHHTYRWSKSSEECCKELSWPSLSTRRKYLSLTMIYDILHNHVSLQFSDYFTFSSASTRSHSLSLLCKQSSINSYRYSFFVNSIFWWNSIPFSILSITRRTTFRCVLYNSLCVD